MLMWKPPITGRWRRETGKARLLSQYTAHAQLDMLELKNTVGNIDFGANNDRSKSV